MCGNLNVSSIRGLLDVRYTPNRIRRSGVSNDHMSQKSVCNELNELSQDDPDHGALFT